MPNRNAVETKRHHYSPTISRIILASQSDAVRYDRCQTWRRSLKSCSLASRTAAMIDAANTSVEANRSVIRLCSSIVFARSRSSRAMARFISPISQCQSEIRGVFISRSWDSRSRKMSTDKYRRLLPQRGHSATIHESGKVCTGAAIFC